MAARGAELGAALLQASSSDAVDGGPGSALLQGSSSDAVEPPLLDGGNAAGEPPPRVYAARWWVLAQYALFTALQGWAWAIPGSVGDTYVALYGLSTWTLQLFLNYGALLFLVVALPVGYAMDKPGGIMRQVLLGSALVTAGAGLRCCATDAGAGSIACLHASYICTALAGPAAMSAVAKLSEEWFPPGERTTATAIATIFNGLGCAFSALVGPAMVAAGGADTALAAPAPDCARCDIGCADCEGGL